MEYWNNDRVVAAQIERRLPFVPIAKPFIVSGLHYNHHAAQVLNGGREELSHSVVAPSPSLKSSQYYLSPPPSSTVGASPYYYFPSNSKESACLQRMNSISGKGLFANVDHRSLIGSPFRAIGNNGQSKAINLNQTINQNYRFSPQLNNYSVIQNDKALPLMPPIRRIDNGEAWLFIRPPPSCWERHLSAHINNKSIRFNEKMREGVRRSIENPLCADQELLDHLVMSEVFYCKECISFINHEVILFKRLSRRAKEFFFDDWLCSDHKARIQHQYCSYFCAPSCKHRRNLPIHLYDSDDDSGGSGGCTCAISAHAPADDHSDEIDEAENNNANDFDDHYDDEEEDQEEEIDEYRRQELLDESRQNDDEERNEEEFIDEDGDEEPIEEGEFEEDEPEENNQSSIMV